MRYEACIGVWRHYLADCDVMRFDGDSLEPLEAEAYPDALLYV